MTRINVPLDSQLHPAQVRLVPLEEQAGRDVLQRATGRVQEHRRNVLSLVLVTDDEDHRQNLLAELEEYLVAENLRIYEQIQSGWDGKIVAPALVYSFEGVLDQETERFLVSAETVKQFAYEHLPDDFDFSLPGSGLWKAVERELNLSLVWYLCREFGIAGADDPWTGIKDPSERIRVKTGGKPVDLNQREHNDAKRLRGIMLEWRWNYCKWQVSGNM